MSICASNFSLQVKFFLVAFLNVSNMFLPYPLRNAYLRLFGIKVPLSSSIHRGVKFFHVGQVTLGEHSVVNFGCYLDNRRGINIGNNVGIAHDTKIYTLGHDLRDPQFRTRGKEVVIHDNAFVFSNVLIMPGVTIWEGAVVLTGSVVTKDVPPWTIAGGNPARPIGKRDKNIDYTINYNYWFAL